MTEGGRHASSWMEALEEESSVASEVGELPFQVKRLPWVYEDDKECSKEALEGEDHNGAPGTA